MHKERIRELIERTEDDLASIEEAIEKMDRDRDNGIMTCIRYESRRYYQDLLIVLRAADNE